MVVELVVAIEIAGDDVLNGEAMFVSSICLRLFRWGERITVSYFNFDATLMFTGLFGDLGINCD